MEPNYTIEFCRFNIPWETVNLIICNDTIVSNDQLYYMTSLVCIIAPLERVK
jgi:hypothetical protein